MFKQFATRLRLVSSSSDSRNRTQSQEPKQQLSHLNGHGQRITENTSTNGIAPQEPNNGYLGFRSCNQFWDKAKDQWTDAYRVAQAQSLPTHSRIIAYNRKNSMHPHNSHIWVEIHDKPLLDLLRPLFQGYNAFTGAIPGIDARHVYMRREQLRRLLPQSDESQALPAEKIIHADLQQLLEYIEAEFAGVTFELEHMKKEEDPHIKWDLLWALFVPGESLETSESISGLDMAFKPKTWVYSDYDENDSSSNSKPCFEVHGEFLEWTGSRYTPTRIRRVISRYAGTKSIHTLAFKPLTPSRKSNLTKRGKQYIKLAGMHHRNYQSYIMWEERERDSFLISRRREKTTKKARADGRVMVDILSFRRFNPEQDIWDADDLADINSQDRGPSELREDSPELYLLPPTVFGWSFALKRWGQLIVEKLTDITFETDAFAHLVLPEDDKELIQALVEAQAKAKNTPAFEDVIPGKGNGLVMLFHGNTGTGKTLTAEAVSEYLKLPLYSVSSHELREDSQMGDFEASLKHILAISSLWKAVLLIDEADNFVQERSIDAANSGGGSSKVVAFLRVLEYHSGIVILTTNYVRDIDRALRSRINLALKYNNLDPGREFNGF